jgi:putative MFS transporter
VAWPILGLIGDLTKNEELERMPASPTEIATSAPIATDRRAGRFYWLVTALGSLAFAGNGVILAAISFAMPGLRREWGLTPVELGWVSAGVAAGQVCGSLLVGWLADHWGRRRAFSGTITLMGLAVGLAGLAPNPPVLTLLLFASGFGFSGVAPVATSLLSEFVPPRIRGQAMAWTQVFWGTGYCLSALGGAALAAGLGWRWILALGMAPIVVAILSWRVTPESPRFLLAHGRRAEAEAVVRDLEARYGVRLPLPEQQPAARRASPLHGLRELWGPALRRRTITLWLTWFIMVAAFNGPIIWLPTILAAAGGSDALAARSSLIVGLFMLPASALAVVLIDRLGRRPLLLVSLPVAVLGAFGLAFAASDLAVILSGGALAGGLMAAWPIVLGYTAELYPTRVRATAAGWAGAVSRTGGIAAPLLLGALLNTWGGGLTLALSVFGGLLALGTIQVALESQETSGRTLEELSG